MPPKAKNAPKETILLPSEVKDQARKFFYKLMGEGRSPWPSKFLKSKGFERKQCDCCHKYFWTCDPNTTKCGDSSCVGGYSFVNNKNPNPITYSQAWEDFRDTFKNLRIPHTVVPRYPVVARWRSDVDYVAAGIYCYQPFCVSGESDPPGNPLVQCEFCLRFNDLDNIGKTGRHYSGFNMLGIQVFNHPANEKPPQEPYGETEEIYWKDSCIEFNYTWLTETLKVKKETLTFIEDVWQGGGNCGACVEFFSGGLEIGDMVFTEYAVVLPGKGETECRFDPIPVKVIDVGIGLERIPWLINGGWSSYLYVFDYMLPELSAKLGVPLETEHFQKFAQYTALFDADENKEISKTYHDIGEKMGLNVPSETDPTKTKLDIFKEELAQYSDLVKICDHTRTCLFAIEDGSLPSNVGGGSNIRRILRAVFSTMKERGWTEKLGGIDGIIGLFKSHIKGLKKFVPEFKNIRCLETVIKLEYEKWETGKQDSIRSLNNLLSKKKGDKTLTIDEWIMAIESYGLTDIEISKVSGQPIPDDLGLKIDENKYRLRRLLEQSKYDVTGIPDTKEIFNIPEYEYQYKYTAKVIKVLSDNAFVCDTTILYPTGGGQQHDEGFITVKGVKYEITDIEKVRNVVVFVVKEKVDPTIVGEDAIQEVDENVREILRTQHTATHIVAAAARKVLGPHVWQNGAKKTKYGAHIDLTHYDLPSYETLLEINRVANELILTGAKVHKKIYTRKEAEGKWGFVLYQGGAIPGNAIRVVDIEGIDTEACCGTHCNTLREIGFIKIKQANKVSDGVFRIEFVAGKLASESLLQDMELIHFLQDLYRTSKEDIKPNSVKFFNGMNSLKTRVKDLTSDSLNLSVSLALASNMDKFLIRTKETDAKMYFNGLVKNVETHKEKFNGKSVIVLSDNFFYGLVQKDVAEQLTKEFQPYVDEKKINKLTNTKAKTVEKYGVVGFGLLSFLSSDKKDATDDEKKKAQVSISKLVNDILLKEFTEVKA